MSTQNVALRIAYRGQDFHGWQRYPRKSTIQGELEEALERLCGEPILIEGAGRTDRGAHALGQVASARVPASVDVHDLADRLPGELPKGLRLLDLVRVPDAFHARESATGKTYRYVIWNAEELPPEQKHRVWHVHGELDRKAMAKCLPNFEGQRDFASFVSSGGIRRASTVRDLRRVEMIDDPEIIELVLEADGFLYKMVRNIVRTIVKVGEGRLRLGDIPRILDAKSRQAAPGSAPSSGLYLDQVHYEVDPFDGEDSGDR